jgi:hypothetical protein
MLLEHIESAKKQFGYYKILGEKTFEQLTEEAIVCAIQCRIK